MARDPITRPRVEIAIPYRLPRLPAERQEEMYIVQGEEAQAEYFFGHEEVPDVGSAESRAGGAIALRVEWARIGTELGPLDVESSIPGESRAVSPHPCWSDAVEEIDTAANRLDQVLGEPDTH